MSIQKEFVLRYREDGHVRFQIPSHICDADMANTLTECISKIAGVYRVNLYRHQKKISIRFNESICDFNSLARHLFDTLADLEQNGRLKPSQELIQLSQKPESKLDSFRVTRWAKQKINDAKETIQAAKVLTRLGMKGNKAFIKDPEKATIDFLNDILVLFLIKMHWERITKHWLIMPLKHRYEWMALFYMFFLLVRSRKK